MTIAAGIVGLTLLNVPPAGIAFAEEFVVEEEPGLLSPAKESSPLPKREFRLLDPGTFGETESQPETGVIREESPATVRSLLEIVVRIQDELADLKETVDRLNREVSTLQASPSPNREIATGPRTAAFWIGE
jgi:hypothetical protein